MKKTTTIFIALFATIIALSSCSEKPEPSAFNSEGINAAAGFVRDQTVNKETLPLEDKDTLKGVLPKKYFECAGVVIRTKSDSQPGVDFATTLVYGDLSKPEVLKHVKNNFSGYRFEEGYPLDRSYYRSHMTTFYTITPNKNIFNALQSLNRGDKVIFKGYMVYLETENGTVSTNLSVDAFKCKYVYLTEVVTPEHVYR